MKLGIMQPYFLPYIGYFQLIKAVDKFVVLNDVNYINRGWINRNRILINGMPKYITIPLCNASQNKLIIEISIVDHKIWRKNLLKTIELNYKKAPFFDLVYPELLKIFVYENLNLDMFVGNSIKIVSKYLGIETEFVYSSEIDKNNELKAQEKIVDICKRMDADTYINAIGGQELYNREEFLEKGIDLKFIQTNAFSYPQFKNEFVANLSILDVMMFNSPEEINVMLDKYELI